MFGKHFASMYTGSMVGAGWAAFGVMGYVIANMRPDAVVGAQVELNPKIMATIFGASEKEVRAAIEFLCRPDGETRTPGEDGRRLVKVGTFDYRVVNGAKYLAIREEADRREANRISQAKCRAAKKANGARKQTPSPGEDTYEKIYEEHGEQAANEFLEKQRVLRAEKDPTTGPRYAGVLIDNGDVVTLWSCRTYRKAAARKAGDARCQRIDYCDGKDDENWTEGVTSEIK